MRKKLSMKGGKAMFFGWDFRRDGMRSDDMDEAMIRTNDAWLDDD